jgi:periplasmic divalent cation tolerance protein
LLLIKTTRRKFPEVAKAVKQIHSYEVPEIIALPIEDGSEDYLNWIAESVREKKTRR